MWEWFKVIGVMIICGLLYKYENASSQRVLILSGAIIALLASFLIGQEKPYKYIVELIAIGVLMYFSRFTLNLTGIFLMVLTLVQSGLKLEWLPNLGVLATALATLGYNFYILTAYDLNYERKLQMTFILLVLILTNTLASLVRRMSLQGKEIEIKNEALALKHQEANDALAAEKNARELLEMAKKEVVALSANAERADIARKLHDDIGHEMTGLIMELEMVKRSNGDAKNQLVDQALIHARDMLAQTRSLVVNMDKGTKETLKKRLETRCYKFKSQTGIDCDLDVDLKGRMIGRGLEEVIYKGVLEALTNIAKHTKASEVFICLTFKGQVLSVSIEDNGGPVEAITMGNGLKFMSERVSFYNGHMSLLPSQKGLKIQIEFAINTNVEMDN